MRKMKIKGLSVDHIFPVSWGYDMKISPFVLAHKNNLQILTKSENSKKHNKIILSIDDLFLMTNKTKYENDVEFSTFLSIYEKEIEDINVRVYEKMVNVLGYGI